MIQALDTPSQEATPSPAAPLKGFADILAQDEQERAELNSEQEEQELAPIVALGKAGKEAVFWARLDNQLHYLSPKEFDSRSLLNMANLTDYARWVYPTLPAEQIDEKKRQILSMAADRMQEESLGLAFSPSLVKGAGFWNDSELGGIVYNTGQGCYLSTPTDPAPRKIPNTQGRHVYNAGWAWAHPAKELLTMEEGGELIRCLDARTWCTAGSGRLLAGWCVCSILSGCLSYRPPAWINAPSNAGKTYLRDDLRLLLKGISFNADTAKSSESGVRQGLKGAAAPVIWDEFENKDGSARTAKSINDVLSVVLTATSGEGGALAKGTASQTAAKAFPMRASFLFSSIHHSLSGAADLNRFLLLRLEGGRSDIVKTRVAALRKVQSKGRALMKQEGFQSRLLSRLLYESHHVKENIKTLEQALESASEGLASGWDSRRSELFAALLAGAHALDIGGVMSKRDIAAAVALAFKHLELEESTSDAQAAIDHLASFIIRTEGGEATIRQLLARVLAPYDEDATYSRKLAADALEKYLLYGYTYTKTHRKGQQFLKVASKLPELQALFKNTPWASGNLYPVFMADAESLGIIGTRSNGQRISLIPALLVLGQGEQEEEEEA